MASVFNATNGVIQVALGDTLDFIITPTSTEVPDKYQVYKVIGNTVTALTSTARNLVEISITPSAGVVDKLYAPQGTAGGSGITDLLTISSTDWTYGDKGVIVGFDVSGSDDRSYVQPFQVVRGGGIERLWEVETSDTDAKDSTKRNTILGRLMTNEMNQIDIIMPRLKRVLGLLGEHQVVDAFLYDDDGNIKECRLRIFDTLSNASSANKWTDRLNTVDPRDGADTGEIGLYTITADNLLPRNLRTLYEQKISADASDNAFGGSGGSAQ